MNERTKDGIAVKPFAVFKHVGMRHWDGSAWVSIEGVGDEVDFSSMEGEKLYTESQVLQMTELAAARALLAEGLAKVTELLNPHGAPPHTFGLREIRLHHWREVQKYRAQAKYIRTSLAFAEASEHRREEVAADADRQADNHLRYVQWLNYFFPVGDTAEQDQAKTDPQHVPLTNDELRRKHACRIKDEYATGGTLAMDKDNGDETR